MAKRLTFANLMKAARKESPNHPIIREFLAQFEVLANLAAGLGNHPEWIEKAVRALHEFCLKYERGTRFHCGSILKIRKQLLWALELRFGGVFMPTACYCRLRGSIEKSTAAAERTKTHG